MMKYILDISGHQGEVNFSKVKETGITGVILKATEGDGYVSPAFIKNYWMARKAGLLVGAYHFLRAATAEAAEKEGDWFGKRCKGLTLELGLALDMEEEGCGWSKAKLTAADCSVLVEAFAKGAASHGRPELAAEKTLLLYGSISYFKQFLSGKELEGYPLWLANPDLLDFDREVKLVQYSWKGKVDGIEGPVDLNVALDPAVVPMGLDLMGLDLAFYDLYDETWDWNEPSEDDPEA